MILAKRRGKIVISGPPASVAGGFFVAGFFAFFLGGFPRSLCISCIIYVETRSKYARFWHEARQALSCRQGGCHYVAHQAERSP